MNKKLVAALLMSGMLLSGCGSNGETVANNDTAPQTEKSDTETQDKTTETPASEMNESPETETEPQTEETSDTPYEIGASASLKDWAISVTDAQIVESITGDYITFSPNEEGNKFIQVFVTVSNEGKQSDRFLPSFGVGDDVNAKVLYEDGYEFSASNLLGYDNNLFDSTINPLSSQTGEIAFEIPSTVADAEDELLIQFSAGNDAIQFKIR